MNSSTPVLTITSTTSINGADTAWVLVRKFSCKHMRMSADFKIKSAFKLNSLNNSVSKFTTMVFNHKIMGRPL